MKNAADPPVTATGVPRTGAPGPGRRYVAVLAAVAAGVLAADAISKAVVVTVLAGHPPVRLLGGLLTLRLLRNSGAAFSIGTSMTVVFTLIAVGVIIFIGRTARRLRSLPWAITLGLLLGGAAGNLGDRLLRAPGPLHGSVVDWIELPHWPVFNLADSSIVCGGVLAVLLAIRGLRLDGSREGAHGDVPGDATGDAGRDAAANVAGPVDQPSAPPPPRPAGPPARPAHPGDPAL